MTWIPSRQVNTDTDGGTDYVAAANLVVPSTTGAKSVGTDDSPLIVQLATTQSPVPTTALTNAQLISAINTLVTWATPKEQISVIKTITSTTTIAPCKSYVLARLDTNTSATVTVQGVDSTEPPFSLGIEQGISASVINPIHNLTGLNITVSGTGSVNINAIILIDKPA